MAQSLKNYYQLLELEAFSDIESVKSAFRKLARRYHPDLNPGDKAQEEKFKQINEAYDILGSPEKKAFYDESLRIVLKHKPSGTPNGKPPAAGAKPNASAKPNANSSARPSEGKTSSSPSSGSSSGAGSSTPINDLFETFIKKSFHQEPADSDKSNRAGAGFTTGSTTGGSTAGFASETLGASSKHDKSKHDKPKRGQDVTVETVITPQEAKDGVVKTVNVQHHELCRRCSGTGKVSGRVCTACQGEKVMTRLKKIDVRIPAGVKTGSKVRVAGEGGRGDQGADHGDLFLQIQVQIDPTLRIEGLDVHGELAVSVTDAVLGADVQVSTMHGSMKMTIPPLSSSGRVFRLKEQGVHSGGSKGDHFVTLRVVTPETLSAREKELYQELARLYQQKSDER